MRLLSEVLHSQGVNLQGRMISREAVRGIVFDRQKLLMVYSKKNGDYKFPGGGIEPGESRESALIREIQEETGLQVKEILGPFGKVIEYDFPIEKDYDVFRMTSYYYWCRADRARGRQSLDRYEKELGFRPAWVEIDFAIRTNLALVHESRRLTPRWVRRDVEVLEQLRAALAAGTESIA